MKDPIRYGQSNVDGLFRLWPDAAMAPHIPPMDVLHQFIDNPAELEEEEPDLVEQFQDCPLTQYILDEIKKDTSPTPTPPWETQPGVRRTNQVKFSPGSLTDIEISSYKVHAYNLEGATTQTSGKADAGCLYSTLPYLPYWDGKRMKTRITFQPSRVLLLGKYPEIDGEPPAWRGVPVIPSQLVSDEETARAHVQPCHIDTYTDGLALMDFIRPILSSQLVDLVYAGCLQGEHLEQAASYISGQGLLDHWEPGGFCSQELATASLLDAQREFDEEMQDFFQDYRRNHALANSLFTAFTLSSIQKTVSLEKAIKRGDRYATHELVVLSDPPSGCECQLPLSDFDISEEGQDPDLEWEIPNPLDSLVAGMPFFLLQKTPAKVLGHGLVHHAEEEEGLSAKLGKSEPDILDLLIKEPDGFLLVCPGIES